MIISRTPCRMSFVGGGTDIPAHYLRHGGAVVSTTIDKYINVIVNHKFDSRIRLSYSKTENCDGIEQIQHPIVRECLRLLNVSSGIEIVSMADIPANGTGLGSSSAFTVGLLNALYAHIGRRPTKHQLGRDSCRIEIDICGEPIGKQDQYASAFGGLNYIRFNKEGTVDVEPIDCSEDILDRIEACMIGFYTGIQRSASELLAQQSRVIGTGERDDVMNEMAAQAEDLRAALRRGECDSLGIMMRRGWELKRSISPNVSSGPIDGWHDRAIKAGALGGKLLGAGGGGFLVFFAPPEKHPAITEALSDLAPFRFRLDRAGSKIIFGETIHG